MNSDKDWLKFVISGKVDDYIKYCDSCRKENLEEGNGNALYNRCSCNKGNANRGERPSNNPDDT